MNEEIAQENKGLIRPIAGIRLASINAGIKYQNREDVVLIEIAPGAECAAAFTQNAFCAAPVQIARLHLTQNQHQPRYLLINAGNANAATGEGGYQDAIAVCQCLAELTGEALHAILPFSTGVIGVRLPVEKMQAVLPALLNRLEANGWDNAARAIMTTDTVPKVISRAFQTQAGITVSFTGMAKGVGMICPNMATMLAFLATDAQLPPGALSASFQQALARSFNRISVDGDTSTNDACILLATGKQWVTPADMPLFQATLNAFCEDLAQQLVRDGEGATKLMTIAVQGGRQEAECLQVAYTIAHSPLVKTAFFASDPNWGRIVAAIGRAGIENLDTRRVDIWLDEVCIVHQGGVAAAYQEADGQRVMQRKEITIRVHLGRGEAQARVWTCDFSYEYVRINAEYRS